MIILENVILDLPVDRRTEIGTKTEIGGEIFVRNRMRYIRALNDVTVSIKSGDRVALIGRNGAGKSTLLRLLAGIYQPSHGVAQAHGKISTLFSSSLGLYLRDTGRRNIDLGARLLGLQGAEIEKATGDIIEFTELGDYIDVPMSAYSAGMRTRLGFAISTQMKPDILLVDEVFGAGDIGFIDKAMVRMERMMEGANILVLASHSGAVIRQCCNKALWLNQGQLKAFGDITDVLPEFEAFAKKS